MKAIRTASSIVDYVAQFMMSNFGESAANIEVELELLPVQETVEISEEQSSLEEFGNEGITCPLCGSAAKRIGNCAIRCTNCNQTTRSGCGE